MNIETVFNRGYGLVQFSETEFRLIKIGEERLTILEFEVDEIDFNIKDVYKRLLSELEYNIRDIESKEDGFEDLKPRHYASVKRFLTEITLIRDFLI